MQPTVSCTAPKEVWLPGQGGLCLSSESPAVLWDPQHEDMDLLEWVQRRPWDAQGWDSSAWGQAEGVGLFSLQKKRLQGDIIGAFQYLRGLFTKSALIGQEVTALK